MLKTLIAAAASMTITGSAVAADGLGTNKLFGHDVTISGPSNEEVLKVDGREMHQNAYVSLDEVTIVDGTPVAIGNSSMGGNACDGAYFFLSFPKNAAPKLDGPIESCFSTSYEVHDAEVIVATGNIPGEGQSRWRWTPANGIQPLDKVAFSADKNGWEILRERKIGHPGQLLSNGEISAQLKQMIGGSYESFQRTLNGVGSGEFQSDDWFGQSCTPHMCTEEEAIVFLSGRDRKVYAAWKPYGQKIKVWPPVKEWPEKAKVHLRSWADKWK